MNTSIEANKSLNQINKVTYVSKNFYSPKNYLDPTKPVSAHLATTSVHNGASSIWNSSKVLLGNNTKEKAALFKSQKYIRDFKGNSILSSGNDSSIVVKK